MYYLIWNMNLFNLFSNYYLSLQRSYSVIYCSLHEEDSALRCHWDDVIADILDDVQSSVLWSAVSSIWFCVRCDMISNCCKFIIHLKLWYSQPVLTFYSDTKSLFELLWDLTALIARVVYSLTNICQFWDMRCWRRL